MNELSLRRARERLTAAEHDDLSASEVCARITTALHDIALFDCCALMTTDPETMLPSGGVVEGFHPSLCAPFWDSELFDPDFNKFSSLARSVDPVATLAGTLEGELDRSPRYRKLYATAAPADELRVAFVSNGSCLAVGVFLRPTTAGPFPADEIARVRELVPLATTVLQRALGRVVHDLVNHQPVVVLLDDEDRIVGMTPGGRQILEDLRTTQVDVETLPGVVKVAIMKARWPRGGTEITTRVRSRTGRWLRLHVAPMEGDTKTLAVSIQSARSDDLVPILLESYGLTERETDIVLLLCRGLATKEVAATLGISPHTVRDHVKAIYEKTKVKSRGELVAKLFSAHVLERFHNAVTHVA